MQTQSWEGAEGNTTCLACLGGELARPFGAKVENFLEVGRRLFQN